MKNFLIIPISILNKKIILNSIHSKRKYSYDDDIIIKKKNNIFEYLYCLEFVNDKYYEIIYSVALSSENSRENYDNHLNYNGKIVKYEQLCNIYYREILDIIFFKCLEFNICKIEKRNGLFFNPFKLSECGEKFSKYTHIAKLETTFFINIYFFNEVEAIPKKLPINKRFNSIVNVKRNTYFKNFRCLKVEDKPTASASLSSSTFISFKKQKKNILKKNYIDLIIGYDCETIFYNGKHRIYMIYAKILNIDKVINENISSEDCFFKDTMKIKEPLLPSLDFFWHLNTEIDFDELTFNGAREFKIWIEAHINFFYNFTGVKLFNQAFEENKQFFSIRIFGFNNNNFDNHLIYEELRKMENSTFEFASRFNKLTYCKLKINNFVVIELTDIIKWLPDKTLEEACQDYDIVQAKLDIDIVAYNNLCRDKKVFIKFCDATFLSQCLKKTIKISHLPIVFKNYYDKNSKTFNIFDLICDYCKRDVDAILEIYDLIENNIKYLINVVLAKENINLKSDDFLFYISVPQLSFQILEETLRLDNESLILFKSQEQNEFIIDSYFGGRTDFTLIGEYISSDILKYYDVTSEYSLAMTGYFPSFDSSRALSEQIDIGKSVNISLIQKILDSCLKQRNELFENKKLHEDLTFFKSLNDIKAILRCNVYPPENLIFLSTWSPIPTRISLPGTNKLKYLNIKQYSRVLNTVQMRSLILAGWKIEILFDQYNIFFKNQKKIFNKFIQLIGGEKTKAREENKTYAKLLKLLLNSAQGKLAQKPQHLIHRQVTKFDDNGLDILENDKYLEQDWVRSYHYLASFIGAEANWIIWSTCYFLELEQIYKNKSIEERVGTICYCDTDSIIFDSSKISSFVTFSENEEIGVWNDDIQNFDITWKKKYDDIKSILVMAKKCYFLVDSKKKLLNYKIKGLIRKEAMKLNYETIKDIIASDGIVYNFNKLAKKANILNNSELFKYNQDIINDIVELDTKRKIVKDENIFEIICKDESILKNNEENLNFVNNNFLKFTCSQYYTELEYTNLVKNDEEKMNDIFDAVIY